jgi:hypothetical protein
MAESLLSSTDPSEYLNGEWMSVLKNGSGWVVCSGHVSVGGGDGG